MFLQKHSLFPGRNILLISRSRSKDARNFYHTETLRGGCSVRQLQRQIDSQFYERVALSKNKAALLQKEEGKRKSHQTTPEEEIKDPYILEFLGLKDNIRKVTLKSP